MRAIESVSACMELFLIHHQSNVKTMFNDGAVFLSRLTNVYEDIFFIKRSLMKQIPSFYHCCYRHFDRHPVELPSS